MISSYQRSDSPRGGNTRNSLAENDESTTIASGASMNRQTAMARTAPSATASGGVPRTMSGLPACARKPRIRHDDGERQQQQQRRLRGGEIPIERAVDLLIDRARQHRQPHAADQ